MAEEITMDYQLNICVSERSDLGEGPIWDDSHQILHWVDITGQKLHSYDPRDKHNMTFECGQAVGTVVSRASGGVMLALHHGFGSFEPTTGMITMIYDPELHLPDNRFNDGKCDPAGRFWAGTMAFDANPNQGSLYCMETDLSVSKKLDNISISNGIAWSLDHRTMYYIDSLKYNVHAYDYDIASGDIDNERVAISVAHDMGMPDGMVIDAEGMLWIAHYGGGQVCRWHPNTGELLQTIRIPTTQVTACGFGGSALDTLYVTTACYGLSRNQLSKQPLAGALFSTKPGIKGVPAFQFQG